MRLIKEPFAIARGSRIRVDLISRILSVIDVGIIYLGSTLPPTSSGAPGAFCGTGRSTAPASPCSRWGLPGQRRCCRCRCALTTPFHPRIVIDAFCSLLHLPSGHPARPLAGIVALWSADFPRQDHVLPRFPRSTRISHYTVVRVDFRKRFLRGAWRLLVRLANSRRRTFPLQLCFTVLAK